MKEPVPEHRALVVLPPDVIAKEIDRWRRLYDPNYAVVPPHITVAYPPFVPEPDWPAVRPALAECLSQFPPFVVQFRELGVFAADSHYLWLKPEHDGSLARIHATLAECFPQYMSELPFEYRCHVTIGVFNTAEDLSNAEQRVLSELSPCGFEVDHVVYMSPDSRGLWCVCSQLPLGRTAAW